jgi:AAA domain-containing protein
VFDGIWTLGHIQLLEKAILSVNQAGGKVLAIVIDPVGSVFGTEKDSYKDTEVRSVLAPLAVLAQKYGAAAILIAHRRKATSNHADDLAIGSRAFTALCRAVWHLTRDTANKLRRLFLAGKMNLCQEPTGLAFTIEGDPAAIQWERDPVELNADEALSIENKHHGADSGRQEIIDWLRALLADLQEHPAKEIRDAAKEMDYCWRTVQRAAKDIGVKRHRKGFGGKPTWRLPKPGTIRATDMPHINHGTNVTNGTNGETNNDIRAKDDTFLRQGVSGTNDEPGGSDER